MILADTSIWIEHLNRGNNYLASLLDAGEICIHPFIIGELSCGHLQNRGEILRYLHPLPKSPIATDHEALTLTERHSLMGRGIGYIDVHLLAASAIAGDTRLWTRDKRLKEVARYLDLAHDP